MAVHAIDASTLDVVHESLLHVSCSLKCSLASVMQVPAFSLAQPTNRQTMQDLNLTFAMSSCSIAWGNICNPVLSECLSGMAHAVPQP